MTENMNIDMDEPMVDVSSESNDLDTLPLAVDSGKQSGMTQSEDVDIDNDDDDDESTVIIGEIDVDEYFDDIFNEKGVVEENTAVFVDQNAQGGSSSVGNANDDSNATYFSNLFQHTSVVTRKKNDGTGVANPGIISYPPRAAAVKASVSIANSCAKRKRSSGENWEQALKYKLIEHRTNMNSKNILLKDFGIVVPSLFYKIFLQDKHLLMNDNFILRLPASLTVHDILTAYSKDKSVNLEVLGVVLEAFDVALPKWCLFRIEQLQYENMVEKFPTLRMSQIYGLSHLIRFISCLPKLFNELNKYRDTFIKNVSMFIRGFLTYMVEENICVNIDTDYNNVMPDYYRKTCGLKQTKMLSRP